MVVTARVLSNVEAADGVVSHLSDNSVARSGQAEHQGILCATQEGIESAVHGEGTGNGAREVGAPKTRTPLLRVPFLSILSLLLFVCTPS